MPRLGLGLGLNLPRPIWFGGGGGSPVFPTAGNVGYYSAEDISNLGFSSANSVNFIDDQSSASNDLTQGTASANPLFIEHDTVTQFTLANQPTLVDLGGGELAMDVTGTAKYFNDFPFINNGDFVAEYVINSSVFSTTAFSVHRLGGNDYINVSKTKLDIYNFSGGQGFNQFNFGYTLIDGEHKFKIKRSGDDVSVFVDDLQVDVTKTIAGVWSIPQILGRLGTNTGQFKRVRLWDSDDESGTPTFELLPTEESCNVLAGNPVSRWNATSHKPWLNRLLSNGNDDHLEGMPVQTGDFTYMFKLAFNALSTTEYIFSNTTGDSAVVLLSDNYIYLRDTTGANDIGLTGHTVEAGEHVYTITREGNSLKYYVDSCLKDTIDVTGRTFELDTFGSPTDSLSDLTAELGVWNRALTKEELDYFSYLRSEDTGEIEVPTQLPNCPI